MCSTRRVHVIWVLYELLHVFKIRTENKVLRTSLSLVLSPLYHKLISLFGVAERLFVHLRTYIETLTVTELELSELDALTGELVECL